MKTKLTRLLIVGTISFVVIFTIIEAPQVFAANKNVWIYDPVDTHPSDTNMTVCVGKDVLFSAQTSWPQISSFTWTGATKLNEIYPTSQADKVFDTAGGPFDVSATYNGEVSYVAHVTVVAVQSITVINGPTGPIYNVSGPDWAGVKDPNNNAIAEVTLNPNTDAAASFVTWNTGNPVPGYPRQRSISMATSAKTTVTASCGTSSASLNVWIVWATVSIQTSGTTPPNAVQFGTAYDGTENLGGQTYNSGTIGVGKVVPIAQLTPAGVHNVIGNGWSFKRERWSHTFLDGAPGGMYDSGWTDDTSSPTFQNLIPDSADKIYDRDAPNVGPLATICVEINKSFHQWVEWNGTRASDGTPGTATFPISATWYWKAKWQSSANPQVILKEVAGGNISLPNASAGCP